MLTKYLLPLLITLPSTAESSPFIFTDGNGSTYTFSHIGPWNKPTCREYYSGSLTFEDIIHPFTDSSNCETKSLAANAWFTASIQNNINGIPFNGLIAELHGGGFAGPAPDAKNPSDEDAFSRHDYTGNLYFESISNQRVRIEWSFYANGLGSGFARMNRVGDIDGPSDPSPYIFEQGISAYINPIYNKGTKTALMPAGKWLYKMVSTHQSNSPEEGFNDSNVSMPTTISIVPISDANGDGTVNTSDLLQVVSDWDCAECNSDLNGDGTVNVIDVLLVVSNYGETIEF